MATTESARPDISLAKGPIAILGLLAIAYGVLALIFGGSAFALHVPHGRVGDGHFLGLLTNGWTDLLFIAAGLLLVLGAPAHWTAKSNAMIVAVALGAAAVIGAVRGNGVFGIFAANGTTEIVWGGVAIVCALLALLPRVGRGRPRRTADPLVAPATSESTTGARATPTEPVIPADSAAPAGGERPVAHRERPVSR